MVKSVLGVNHQGLREWVIQRASAILLAVYTIGLFVYFLTHPGLTHSEWRHLFTFAWVKVSTLLVLLSLLFHAWIGVWTIFTDYIKLFVLRCILDGLVILTLISCFFWGFMILWSV